MKPLQIIALVLIACGVLCLAIALMMRGGGDGSEAPSNAPLLVGASGVFDIVLGTALLVIGRRGGGSRAS